MSDTEKKVRIGLDDQLSPELAKIIDRLGGLHTGLLNMSAALQVGEKVLEVVGEAFHFVTEKMGEAIKEALEAEKAQTKLNGALIASGQYTKDTAHEIDEYVVSLEKQKGVNGETARSQIAMGLQMELTTKQAMEMEEAARKLAVATGQDVTSAFSLMQGALSGQVRGLARVLPQIKDLTSAQLKQGAAIDVVNKAFATQYAMYQDTLPAALSRVQVAMGNVYKELGKTITESPAVREATSQIGKLFTDLAEFIKENKGSIIEFVNGAILVMIDAFGVANMAVDALYRVGQVVWSSMKIGAESAAIAILKMYETTWSVMAKLPVIGDQYKSAAEKAHKAIEYLNKDSQDNMATIAKAASGPTDAYKMVEDKVLGVREAVVKATLASDKAKDTFTEVATAQSKQAKAALDAADAYDHFTMGTRKSREALEAETQTRDKNLKEFKTYLENKQRLAITAAEEQEMEVGKIQAGLMKDEGGSAGKSAEGNAKLDAENKTQADLNVAYQTGLLTREQFNAASLASDQRFAEVELSMKQAQMQKKAELLGETDDAVAMKKQTADQQFQLKLQDDMARAEMEGAETDQIQAAERDALAAHLEEMEAMDEAHYSKVAGRSQVNAETISATRSSFFSNQKKMQADAQKSLFSGVSLMEGAMTSLQSTTAKIGQAMIANQGMSAKAMVGMFLESFGTQIQQKGFGDLVMSIFPPNPVGLAAGAAEVALGTVIGRLGHSMSASAGGGKADSGMDSIPQSLDGKSFILSGGERVVQPTANKDLTRFLDGEKQGRGGSSGPQVINITISGAASKESARESVTVMIEELRRASERGVPIISEKGIIKEL